MKLRATGLCLNGPARTRAPQATSAQSPPGLIPQKSLIPMVSRHSVSLLHATFMQVEFVDKKNAAVIQH